ncbi:MAG: ribosome maturation factor RimP [Deltaproteobacteria bacterium]|nr:ribosome maturation factor RimP [bacterium]MCB9477183.1 ribosome maturation factor RimP [Deltaproteobacteria bacterium]MCB9479071.1 ribosome maturation factor RimP [Deltaproteobacteria bacterium]MCB9488133.1 ribosome maturation factor RimP [Deltaproteobacteria bacterium]
MQRTSDERLDRIREFLDPVCAEQGLEVFDLEMAKAGRRSLLRVYLDRPGGAVSVDDCAAVSRELSDWLDVQDMIAGTYNLEVSSPGLDRPIRHHDDAVAMIGKLVKVRTRRDVDGRKKFTGRLLDVKDGQWIVQVDAAEYAIDEDLVDKANMVYEF